MAGESDDVQGLDGVPPDRPHGETDPAPVRELPLKDYKNLTIPEIIEQIPSLSPDELREIQDFERNHRRRKTLLVRLERHLRSVTE
jgi:hypothetical protein